MTPQEIRELVADVQRRRGESDSIEVKAAHGGTPKRLYESLSAFANRPGGGVVLFGLAGGVDRRLASWQELLRADEGISNIVLIQTGIGRWRRLSLKTGHGKDVSWRLGL